MILIPRSEPIRDAEELQGSASAPDAAISQFMRRGIVDSSVSSSACPGVDKLSDHAAIALNLELLSMDWTVLYVSNTMVKTIYVSSALPRGIRTTNPWFVEHNAPDYVTVYTDGSCYTPASPLRRMIISSRSIDREGLSEQLLAD